MPKWLRWLGWVILTTSLVNIAIVILAFALETETINIWKIIGLLGVGYLAAEVADEMVDR